ncbi:MAG: hypothetical protein ACTIKR_12580 [Advenella sp.]|uniref:hypothetical protein n=1 Tax=Advenella sp. TaxID=1872388 RepID=UPI003F9D194E
MRKAAHKMSNTSFFVFNLFLLSFSLFVSFFIAARLTQPAIELLDLMNSGNASLGAWMGFIPTVIFGTLFMTALILVVEYTKTNLIELLRLNNK